MAMEASRRVLAGALILVAAGFFNEPVRGADSEDLSTSKLPHGQVTIPEADAAPAGVGYVLRFSDEKAFRIGAGSDPGELPAQTLERMKRDKQGDLIYSRLNEGSLVDLAGRLTDYGPSHLQDLAKGDLPTPRLTKDGTVSRIQEGSVYLLQATDGNYVLIRLLHRTETAVTVQYIYQPDGGLDFSALHAAHRENPVAAAAATESTPTLTVAPLSQPGPAISDSLPPPAPTEHVTSLGPPPPPTVLMPYLETHLRQRAALISDRIDIVKKTARTDAEVRDKALAIDDLRQLRAQEAVPVLIDEISFLNPHARPAEKFSMETFHPAVGALEALGKPASQAALKAIGELTLADDQPLPGGDVTKSTNYRLHLLVDVIAAVEGTDVTTFILRTEAAKTDTAHPENYKAALKELGQ